MHETLGYTEGAGKGVAADDVGGTAFQRVKLTLGAEGVDDGDVSSANALPARIITTVLPPGAATDAVLEGIITALQAVLAVSVASLPLPAGAATAAKQDAGNTSLASIDGKITAVNTGAVVIASSALPAGAATSAKQPALGTAGAASADVLTVQGAAAMVAFKVDGSAATQPVSAASLPLPAGASTAAKQPAIGTAGAASADVISVQGVAGMTALKVDGSAATQPVSIAATLSAQGLKTNNNAAPGATNLGTLPALANAATPAWSEGNQASNSVDLAGAVRVVVRPPVVLGSYALNGTVAYTATTVNGIIFSFRWGDATRKCRIVRVSVAVLCTAFTTAGIVERQLIVVRSFSASDTGGTALTPSTNNNKLQTAFGTSLVTDARIGGFLSAGTGTADANPLASVPAWMAAVGNVIGGGQLVPLYEHTATKKPFVLAQNEGFRIRLGAAEGASTRQTFVNVEWDEGNNFE